MIFPDGNFKRIGKAEIIGTQMSRGFYIRHCSSLDISEFVSFDFHGYNRDIRKDVRFSQDPSDPKCKILLQRGVKQLDLSIK